MNAPVTRQNDFLDYAKLFFSFMIIFLHSMTCVEIHGGEPFTRVAVPMFFTITGYFYFRKFDSPDANRLQIMKNSLLRLIKLYLFYIVLLSPFLLSKFFYLGLHGIAKLIFSFFLGTVFNGSWFLGACIVGIFISSIIPRKIMWFLSFACYVICVLASSYVNCFDREGIFYKLFVILYPGTIYYSFPVGLIWLCFGREMARREESVALIRIGVVVSTLLLFIEYKIVKNCHLAVGAPYYFSLLPLIICLFLVVSEH